MDMIDEPNTFKATYGALQPPTMLDLIETVQNDIELSPTRKRDLLSAIRRFCEVLGLSPVEVPATHAFFRRRLQHLQPKQVGLSRKTFQNIRACVDFALKRYVTRAEFTRRQALTPVWAALWAFLPAGDLRYGLSRLIRYCDFHGIAPEQVDDSVTERFLSWLREETFVKHPDQLYRRNLVLWNKAAKMIEGWPQVRLTVPSNRQTYCLTWGEVPETLRHETAAWLDHLAGADPLAEDAPPKPASPATIKTREFQIRQIVSALVHRGYEVSTLTSLKRLIDVETAKEALRFFLDRNGGKSSSQIAGLATTLFMIARRWCKVDDRHLERLRQMKSRLAFTTNGLTRKNRGRLRQFAERHNVEALLGFPQDIHDRVRRKAMPTVADARDMQIALAVELLLMMPIRRANLVALSERHIIRPSPGRNAVVYIVIPGEEVKNGQDLDFPLPRESAELLDLYIRDYRPLLAPGPSEWLFPGDRPGHHKSLDGFSHHFSKIVRRYTGLEVNMHLMRHIGAKLYLDRNPGAYEVVRRVLAHTSLSTTVNNYTGLETEAAVRHFDAVILGIRNSINKETDDV